MAAMTEATPAWTSSLKQQECESCGRAIFPGVRFLRWPWFPGRRESIACCSCAVGEEEARNAA